MLDEGLLHEVKDLYAKYPGDIQSKKGIGYKEFSAYLEERETLEEAVEKVKQHSRNYAKRQLTWFRNRFTVDLWADLVADPDDLNKIKEQVSNFL